jgi:ABC-2 type transport system permease protein
MTVEETPRLDVVELVDITGPQSFVGGWRRVAYLSYLMARTEWKLRFFDSLLGYLWTLVRPLLVFGVLYVVFSVIIDIDAGVPHYPALLLTGMVLYLFFVEATTRALTSVVDSENLVRKVHFPLMAIPASALLIAIFGLALNMIVLAFFVLINGVEPRLSWLELPLIMVPLIALALGTSAGLAALYVRARDVNPIWDVTTQALFYLTPIIYPIQLVVEKAGSGAANLLMVNPLAAIVQQARHAIVGPSQPTAASAIGGELRLLIPIGITLAIMVGGCWLFARWAVDTVEDLRRRRPAGRCASSASGAAGRR